MNILNAIRDENLFRPFLADENDSIKTWANWMVALRCLYGLPIKEKHSELVKHCTGRSIESMPKEGFRNALFLVGRRGGKSKIAGLISAYESLFSGREKHLSVGETGLATVVSPSRLQSQIIKGYNRAALSSPLLEQEVDRPQGDGFLLKNGVLSQVLTADFRTVRGFTQISVIADEICYLHLADEGKIRSDTELVAAIRPALITTGGRFIGISTKYSERGWAYKTWKRNFGNDAGRTLVWDSPSKLMNPTLDQQIIDDALLEDPAAARSEFLGEWREDIQAWLPREIIEICVRKSRFELIPRTDIQYRAFVDVSGGRNDDSAIAIGHQSENDGKVIVDFIKRYKAPHNPYEVIRQMAEVLRKFKIRQVVGDNYSAEFVASAFKSNGFFYEKSKLSKSQLYLELLPSICSQNIELLDDEISINQLSNLERRTRSGGKDSVDHPQGGHDDSANVIAGVNFVASKKIEFIGCIR